MNQENGLNSFQLGMILSGILLFILFFATGTLYYPGGSNFDAHTQGYRWNYNYWCELLGEYAKNGEPNRARPFGFAGMISLSVGVACFWLFVPRSLFKAGIIRNLTTWMGVCSMILASLIFTDLHDLVIYGAVVSGTIAFSLLFRELYRSKKKWLFATGIFCLSLILLNCFIYITNIWIGYLPSLQKMTFLLMLLWIIILCWGLRSSNKN